MSLVPNLGNSTMAKPNAKKELRLLSKSESSRYHLVKFTQYDLYAKLRSKSPKIFKYCVTQTLSSPQDGLYVEISKQVVVVSRMHYLDLIKGRVEHHA